MSQKWAKFKSSNILLKKISLDSHQSFFICSLKLLSEMCTIWSSKAQFRAFLGTTVSQNSGVSSLRQSVFTGFASVLLHMLNAITFTCVENMGLRGPTFGSLWAPNQVKIPVFCYFLKYFPLVSHHSSCTCQFELLLEVCWKLASGGQSSRSFWDPT